MTRNLDNLTVALQEKGVLIVVSVRRWRGRRKLRPEDLGLSPEDIDDDMFTLGQKHLVSPDTIRRFGVLESRARQLVENTGFPFLSIARYVPNNMLDDLLVGLDDIKEDFDMAVELFIADYDAVRADALQRWRAYAAAHKLDEQKLILAVEKALPSPKELRAKFAFSTLIFQVDSPSRPTLEQQCVDVRAKAVKRARTEIQSTTQAFISDCITRLRQETAKLCEEVLITVNKTESLSAKTINRLQTFMTRFEGLNFADDRQMAEQIEKFKADLLSAEEYRKSPEAMTSLSDGLTKLRSEALKLITSDPKPGMRIGARAPRALGPADEEKQEE